jgi:hypothetical protein
MVLNWNNFGEKKAKENMTPSLDVSCLAGFFICVSQVRLRFKQGRP